jgi:hypothetical protein
MEKSLPVFNEYTVLFYCTCRMQQLFAAILFLW